MDEKRLEILERASAVYMKLGVKSVTMDDLARELGMSKKTIYKYFSDKTDLVNSIIDMKLEMDEAICSNSTLQSVNAIDELVQLSKLVVEHFSNVNPVVFYDLRKHYPSAWSKLEDHKWKFIQSMIQTNIERGQKEGVYRDSLNAKINSKLYVAATDAIMNGAIFPWPEYKFQEVFTEFIQFQIKGMTNDNGRKYLKQQLNA